jgi:hypothetical protein
LVAISEERGDLESLKAYGQRPSDVNISHGPLIQMSLKALHVVNLCLRNKKFPGGKLH